MAKRGKYEDHQIFVDSGTVWIGDPSYMVNRDRIASEAGKAEAGISEPLGPNLGLAINCHDAPYRVVVHRDGEGRIDSATIFFDAFKE